jgi:hypothetical protein
MADTSHTPRLFLRHVRKRLQQELQQQADVKATEAKRRVNTLSDSVILEAAHQQGVQTAAVVGGTFLDWLKSHLPQILAILAALLPLLLAMSPAPEE